MRFIDKHLLASFRERSSCHWCGRHLGKGRIVPHHVISRGAGGSDIPENLLGVDWECHGYLQEHAPQSAQVALLAWLFKTSPEMLWEFLWAVKRLDKSASLADVQALREQILCGKVA